jgi:hypothetical protein
MELYGCDTVFGCSSTKINKCLKTNMQDMIVTFDYEETGIKISGRHCILWRQRTPHITNSPKIPKL